jgi:hypothetical protein
MTKEKKPYVKPSMKVYPMRQTPQLLAGSGGLGNPDDYNNGGDPFNP